MNQQQKNNKQTKYSEKLKDPRWQKVRLKVFECDEWTCQICFDQESQLKVHYKYYLQGKPLGLPIGSLHNPLRKMPHRKMGKPAGSGTCPDADVKGEGVLCP